MISLAARAQSILSLPFSKILRLNWALILLVTRHRGHVGFLMLYSVAGARNGSLGRAADGAVRRRHGADADRRDDRHPVLALVLADCLSREHLRLLVAVEFIGVPRACGAQRWLNLGPIQLQPSELMKIGVVMALAHYYAWLEKDRVSHPLWVLPPLLIIALPMLLTLKQPDLGTALLLGMGGALVMFLAGVSWWYWGTILAAGRVDRSLPCLRIRRAATGRF